MPKRDAILSRFPDFFEVQDPEKLLYQVIGALAGPLDRLNHQLVEAMWAHWVNRALEVRDLERIAALYGVSRFDGEPRERFRRRLKALVRILLGGTATPAAVLQMVAATLDLDIWDETGRPQLMPGQQPNITLAQANGRTAAIALVETPWKAVEPEATVCVNGQRLGFHQDDFEPVVPTIVITGVGDRTIQPVITNLTNGQVIGYLDTVPDGQRLVIAPDGTARLEGRDVSSRLFSMQGGFYDRDAFDQERTRFVLRRPRGAFDLAGLGRPDFAFAARPAQVQTPALPRGDSDWHVTATIGRFERTAYGRCVWDAPDPQQFRQGLFEHTGWDISVFQLEPSLKVALHWQERERATFEVRVPWPLVQRGPERVDQNGWAYEVDPTVGTLTVRRVQRLRFELYSRTLPAGGAEIILGGNAAAGALGQTTGYFALVRARPSRVHSADPAHAVIGIGRRGSLIYLDDLWTILEQPPDGLEHLALVRTARADITSQEDELVRLTVAAPDPVTLYVAYDALAAAVPRWLRADQGWAKVGQTVQAKRDEAAYTLRLGTAPCTVAWLEWIGEPPQPPPRLLVADKAEGQLHVLDPAELVRLGEGAPGASEVEVELARVPVGPGACSIALLTRYHAPDLPGERNLAYVANFDANTVTVVDLETVERLIVQDPAVTPGDAVMATIATGRGPAHVSLTPDQNEGQVLNLLDRTITRIDLVTNRAVETQPATLPHERVAREIERVRAAGIHARVVYVMPDLDDALRVSVQSISAP
ncbi:MAG: hypothetical protein RML36_09250 [Anaerolineae bacterium]|nr:hypothetical protein [Anaerolineae bacterium]MDW8099652.1 hypothetical protein [Anaerolineae bacterium]